MPDQRVFDPGTGARWLQPGESCTSIVDAIEPWVATGLFVHEGEEYQLTATGRWIDRTYESGPDGYTSPNWKMRLFERFRRVPTAAWFALIGTVDRNRKNAFVIGTSATQRMPASGILMCFANDVPGFYGNNKGAVRLTVRRVVR